MTYLDPFQLMQLSSLEKYFVPVTEALYEGNWQSNEKDQYTVGGLLDSAFSEKRKKKQNQPGLEYAQMGDMVNSQDMVTSGKARVFLFRQHLNEYTQSMMARANDAYKDETNPQKIKEEL